MQSSCIACIELTVAMSFVFKLALMVFLGLQLQIAAFPQEKYTSKYDNVDVDKILNNDRVLTNYIRCMMDEGPCTPEGRELKKTMPDALEHGCSKCSEKQRMAAEKVLKHLINRRGKDWERLTKKYDPQGHYKKKYEEQLKAVKA